MRGCVRLAKSREDIAAVREVFDTYLLLLRNDYDNPCGYEQGRSTMAGFPENHSALFLAEYEGKPVGACGLMRINEVDIELVRLYCKPEVRGMGLGARLVKACIDTAHREGFKRLLLSTEPVMGAAIKLYEGLGFENTTNYKPGTSACSRFMFLSIVSEP